MFETLFTYWKVRHRHQQAPLAAERAAYLTHRAKLGSPRSTLQRWASELLVVCRKLKLARRATFSPLQIRRTARQWAQQQQRRGRAQRRQWAEALFVQTATSLLRFLGRLRERRVGPKPYQSWLDRFVAHLQAAGKSSATVGNYRWHVRRFLGWWYRPRRQLHHLGLDQFDRYFRHLSRCGWNRVSLASAAKALRQFLRFADPQAEALSFSAAAIESPRIYRDESLPSGPAWPEVQRWLAALDPSHPRDIRNRALLILLTCYGFRSSEVSHLRLTDLDWKQKRLRLRRAKSGAVHEYPLSAQAARAVLAYLQKVRPRCELPEVFLTFKAPHRPLSAGAIYHFTRASFTQLGIRTRRYGPHALRHACACRLLEQGFSLKEIGDHLGHRSTSATQLYAKVDLSALQQVANLDLGGLL